MFNYYGSRSHMTADLKRHVHRVRQTVDARPVTTDPVTGQVMNPRKQRLVPRISVRAENPNAPIPLEAPELKPAERHWLAWRR